MKKQKYIPPSEQTEVLGIIPVTKTTEINFYLDTYNGKRYANIRKFTRSEKYTGPTPQGIKLSERNLADILAARERIAKVSENPEELEICRTPKFVGKDIVVKVTLYEGKYGLDFREMFKTEDGGEGFGKGIRLKIENAEEALQYLEKMLKTFNLPPSEGPSKVSEPTQMIGSEKDKEKPSDIQKYF